MIVAGDPMKIDLFGINKAVQNTASTASTASTTSTTPTVQLPIGETTEKAAGSVTTATDVAESDAVVKLSGAEEQIAAEFKETAPGSESEKAETIAFVKRKGLPMDVNVLNAVHKALSQGSSPSADALFVIQSLASDSIHETININQLLDLAGLSKAGGKLVLVEQFVVLQKGDQAILLDMEGLKALLANDGESMEAKLEKLFSSEENSVLKAELAKIVELTVVNESIEIVVSSKTKQSPSHTETSHRMNRNEDLSEELSDDLFGKLEEVITSQVDQLMDQIAMGSNLESNLFKQVLRVEVTKEMQAAKVSFNAFRTELTQKIETQIDAIDPKNSKSSAQDRVAVLEQVIQKTDAFILKSDCMLYTSMKNERDLLKVSSSLQDALKLLQKGNLLEAQNVLRESLKKINQMVFEPSLKRVELQTKQVANRIPQQLKEEQNLKELAQHKMNQYDLKKMIQQIGDQTKLEEASPRMLLELLRSVGLNHECEQAALIEKTQQGTKRDERMDQVDQNLKRMLLDMAEEYAKDPKIEPIKQALDTLMGNQLSNRYESGTQEQTMLFMIPLNAADSEALRVMVNGKKKREGLDWENCNMYLALESKKFGPLGIKVSIQNKTVALTVFNDQPENAQVFKAPLENLMNQLSEIGYNKGRIGFTGFGKKQVVEAQTSVPETIQPKGGFDFKI